MPVALGFLQATMSPAPTQHGEALRRTFRVTPTDQAKDPYFYVPVSVPLRTTRFDVALDYAKSDDCIVDIGLFDPTATSFPSTTGFRGWSGGARDKFFVATDDATPGYAHGALPAGQWKIVLGLYKIPAEGTDIVLTCRFDDAPRAVTLQAVRTAPVRRGAGWYKGDLHCHTFHSDALGAPEVLHAAATQAGLDFLAVTDHNTITQRSYFHAASSPGLVFIRGMEVTTSAGHANVYGVDEWVDFRLARRSDSKILSDMVHARGGLLSINHDKPDIPWDYELPRIDCMEVWQSSWLFSNWISLGRYQQRLASGLRISAIGGSDYHQPEILRPEGPFVLARPTTVLWLDELSEEAVLAAMKAGRGYVTESPRGPHLDISVAGVPMGGAVESGPLEAVAEVRGARGDELVWLDATGVVARQTITADDWIGRYRGTPQKFIRAQVHANASRTRLQIEFSTALSGRAPPGSMDASELETQPIVRALGNPIYLDL